MQDVFVNCSKIKLRPSSAKIVHHQTGISSLVNSATQLNSAQQQCLISLRNTARISFTRSFPADCSARGEAVSCLGADFAGHIFIRRLAAATVFRRALLPTPSRSPVEIRHDLLARLLYLWRQMSSCPSRKSDTADRHIGSEIGTVAAGSRHQINRSVTERTVTERWTTSLTNVTMNETPNAPGTRRAH